MNTTTLRNVAFGVMLCATIAALQTRVLASFDGPIDSFCDSWEDGGDYDCIDCSGGTSGADYSAEGTCDFSGIVDEEELLLTAAAYIQDSAQACDDTCGTEYAEFVAQWHGNFGNPFDPCYEPWQDPDNWITWAQWGGDAGPSSEWSCSCDRFFFAECES